jgi:hypothetical protein
MSKQLFELMQQQQIAESYPTKKQVQANAIEFANHLINNGEHEKLEMFSQAVRIKETINTIYDAIKESIPAEKQNAYGINIEPRSGGETLNYSEDYLYAELQEKLKERAELIKVATKTKEPVYDSNGVEVTKVSATSRKDSLVVTY